ncbi:MAG: aminoacyl-tRNA hydrolase [Acidimicrobiales bacterium]
MGNPGSEFAHTRHNVGADAVALVAQRHGVVLRAERGTSSRAAAVVAGDRRLALAIPVIYMNESGMALAALTRRYGIDDPSSLVVVHDELDLPVGVVRVKRGGGSAGHNGLKSAEQHLGTLEFVRVRIGIGKPPGRMPGADYVLRRPSAAESELLAVAVERAADAVELICGSGLDAAMGAVNAGG